MAANPVRVVVGEGHPARKGLLRFVLEGDGFDVVGSATTSSELARILTDERPDVVVMDDGIGATAVQMAREVAPGAKVVLVWPGAVVPIGGDARVEPSQVLRELGPTVERVTQPIASVTTLRPPEWVERVRKDPSTLRDRLAAKGGVPATRPSITELQRRGQRLHPKIDEPAEPVAPPPEPEIPTPAAAAPIVVLPVDPVDEPTIVLTDEEERDDDAAVAGVAVASLAAASAAKAARRADDPSRTELNRRLGVIALSGAAVIGAAALSLALSGTRVTPTIVAFETPRPEVSGPGFPPIIGPDIDEPGPTGPSGPAGPTGPGDPGPAPAPTYPPRDDGPAQPDPGGDPGPAPDPGPNPGPDPGPGPHPGPGPDPGPTPRPDDSSLPGRSADNPHGGPPGITGVHPWPDGNPGGHVPGTGNGNKTEPPNGPKPRVDETATRHTHKR